jgi:uncharacterized protein (TIRG00374 family)
MNGGRNRKTALLFLGVAISLLFLWLAMRQTDINSVAVALEQADWSYVTLILAAAALFFWFKTVRWRALLSPLVNVRSLGLFPVVVVGYASNILLPAQLGEFVRTYLASRKFRTPAAPVLVTVILERIFDFLTILIFVAIIVPFEKDVPDQLILAGYLCGIIGVGLMSIAVLHTLRPGVLGAVFTSMTRWLPERLRVPLQSQFDLATQGLGSLKDARMLFAVTAYSLAQWLCMGLATWFAIASIGIQLPISGAFVVLAVVVVGMTIPSSPGFFGTIQLCYTIGLAAFGIDAGSAIAASIVFHSVMFISVAVGGAVFVRRMGYSPRDLYHQTEAAVSDASSTDVRSY